MSQYPAKLPNLHLIETPGGSQVMVLEPVTGREFRMPKRAALVLQALDGNLDNEGVRRVIGADDVSTTEVQAITGRLTDVGLVTNPQSTPVEKAPNRRNRSQQLAQDFTRIRHWLQHPKRRIRMVGPLTVEWSLGDPTAFLARFSPIANAVASPVGQKVLRVYLALGLVAIVANIRPAMSLLSNQIPVGFAAAVLITMVLTTSIHEMAHGLTLYHFGQRPRRMGFMLFYGAFAMFCDITNAWRLPRVQRVVVALAGVVVNLMFAATFALAALFSSRWQSLFQLLMLMQLAMVITNLIPFVKLDGYVALTGWTDIPFLRNKSIDIVKDRAAGVVFGARRSQRGSSQVSGLRWTLFGIACLLCGPFFTLIGVNSLAPTVLAAGGRFGAVLILCLLGYFLVRVSAAVANLVRQAQRSGASAPRIATGFVALLAMMVGVPCVAEMPFSQTGAVQRIGDDFYLDVGHMTAAPALGSQVTIRQPGLAIRPAIGDAVVCSSVQDVTFRGDSGSPFVGSSAMTRPVQAVELCHVQSDAKFSQALAETAGEQISVAEWFRLTFVQPSLSTLAN